RIYIVEDNYLLAMSVSELLEEAGAQVVGMAGKLDDAQRFVADNRDGIDAVVLDVNLRSESSYPLAEQLVNENIPFVFTTGYDVASIDPRFRSYPVCCKPFVPDALWEMVSSAVVSSH